MRNPPGNIQRLQQLSLKYLSCKLLIHNTTYVMHTEQDTVSLAGQS